MPSDKISFTKPPLVETVFAIQFNPIENFHVVDYGLLWNEYLKADFPEVREQSPINMQLEGKELVFGMPSLQIMADIPLPRAWFLGPENAKGQELIQLQPNLLIHNWRKKSFSDQDYPRYHSNIDRFKKVFDSFIAFVHERELGELQMNQCELSYINHIPIDQDCKHPAEMFFRVFNVFQESFRLALVNPEAQENVSFTSTYWLDTIASRFHVIAGLVKSTMIEQLVIDFRLVCRGVPKNSSASELINWFDVAHNNIIETFVKLTTSEMHARWEKF